MSYGTKVNGGTASLVAGSAAVNFTDFAPTGNNILEDDLFWHGGYVIPILSVSDDAITLAFAWPGATDDVTDYFIQRVAPARLDPLSSILIDGEARARTRQIAENATVFRVIDRLNAPPVTPDDGDRYLVNTAPTGAWTGRANQIALFSVNAWAFIEPTPGDIISILDEVTLYKWSGAAWVVALESLASEIENDSTVDGDSVADALDELLTGVAARALLVHTHAIADVTGLQAALDAKEALANKGVAGGYAPLGGDGKISTSFLPAAVLGAASYQGTWNANTNSPAIPAAASGNKGWYYIVTTAGTTSIDGISDWGLGDWIISNGATWSKVDNTDAVISVAGLVGVISGASLKAALALDLVNNTADADKPVSTAQATAIALKLDKATLTTKGDLYVRNDAGAVVRLPVGGTNGHALVVDNSTSTGLNYAAVAGGGGSGRELLTANRTYYVRPDGNNSNNGLTNDASGAFLTIQKAVDVVAALDMSIYQVTIQVADGTYTGSVTCKPYLGALPPIIQGNTTTPANCLVSVTSNNCFAGPDAGKWSLRGFKTVTTTVGFHLQPDGNTHFVISSWDFGAAPANYSHICPTGDAWVTIVGNLSITAGITSGRHLNATLGTIQYSGSVTVTLTGTPAFGIFALADRSGRIITSTVPTFVGAATGQRYLAQMNSTIYIGGGGANFFPGNAAGSVATGGQYA